MNEEVTEYKKILMVEIEQLFNATEVALEDWLKTNIEGNLQFPNLLTTLALQFNWSEKIMRENDPIIRKYIRQHPKWVITRGAHGGITLRSEWEKKSSSKQAKEIAKQQIQEKLEIKLAANQSDSENNSNE